MLEEDDGRGDRGEISNAVPKRRESEKKPYSYEDFTAWRWRLRIKE